MASGNTYGPPRAEPLARPWQVGQWVAYKRFDRSAVSLEIVRLIAQDNCGVWLEYVHDDGTHVESRQFCVRGPAAPEDTQLYETLWAVIDRRDGAITGFSDFRRGSADRTGFDWLPALAHASWPGHDELPREDVVVPAGRFAQALRMETKVRGRDGVRWSHPVVPLGGTVKENAGYYERVLVDWGTTQRTSLIIEDVNKLAVGERTQARPRESESEVDCLVGVRLSPRICQTTPRRFLSLAGGFGGVSRNGEVPPLGGWSFRLQLGQRLADRWQLVEEMNVLSTSYVTPPGQQDDEHLAIGAGIRWTPLEPSPRPSRYPVLYPNRYDDFRSLYVSTTVGANARDRVTYTTFDHFTEDTKWSPMVSLALGWLPLQGRDWALGVEVREQVARHDGQFQRAWQLAIAVQLNGW